MRTKMQLLAVLAMVMGGLVSMGLVAPANATGTTQIGGDAVYDTAVCDKPPEGFTSYDGLRLTGSLEGCLYTGVVDSHLRPSGVYIETGHEVFVGSLNGGSPGRSRPTTGSRASTRGRTSPSRSTDAASTRSRQAPGPRASRERPDGSTSRTSSETR